MKPLSHKQKLLQTLLLSPFLFFSTASFAAETKGTLTHPKGTVALHYSYFIKGPDSVDPQKIIERLVFSGNDLGPKIQACGTMNCVDGSMTEGLEVDLIPGPRYNYWMAINGAKIQNSGTIDPSVLKTTARDTKRIVGKIQMDSTAMGGPKVDVDFDATLAKVFTR